jgi:hypothetical protein
MKTEDFINAINDEFDIETLELMQSFIDKRISTLNDLLSASNPRTVVKGFRRDQISEMIKEVLQDRQS